MRAAVGERPERVAADAPDVVDRVAAAVPPRRADRRALRGSTRSCTRSCVVAQLLRVSFLPPPLRLDGSGPVFTCVVTGDRCCVVLSGGSGDRPGTAGACSRRPC